jgi:flagellar biosynthesis/type III secretory pathway chaperone
MSLELFTQLNTLCIELASLVDELLGTLQNEFELLNQQDIENLSEIAVQKKQLSDKIEHIDQQRNQLIAQTGLDNSRDNIVQLLELASMHIKELPDNWRKIEQLTRRCADQNQINGIILGNNRRNVESRLALLRGQPLTPESYSSNGKTTANNKSRTLAQV